ncbi:asparagine synthase (glutamine-hydrolyzing) [Pseudonocardia spinosispora]|uniref:asparagine synthase (glutamine-hydrolyzing) n=1 Tax=Pseudonocardia spinosispora TaxID=103441 RepID=UPI0003FFE737|nr:asparagine synthase (glutamine-hydrolyzing) [Pseudonocardia spinosispora]
MCGIAGWVDFRRDLRAEGPTVSAMATTMASRGPDADGVWLDTHVGFGHRRLSIIDLTGGRQPMTAEDRGRALATITYSGEIYNYRELRVELAGLGHRFRTDSDTEVLLRGYLQWGADVVHKLNGMFAFGIWDSRTEELLLIRDRLGIKPLYYYPTADGLLFGSEQKAILAHPEVSPVVDPDGLREMLASVKNPEHALFRGMYELRPGHLLRANRGSSRIERYWSLQADDHPDDLATTIHTVRDLLADIVDRHLVADVPVCTLLSGGLDSSIVTALAARSLAASGTGPIRSFAVDFEGGFTGGAQTGMHGSPDAPFADELARHIGADHTRLLLNSAELGEDWVRALVPHALDSPGGAAFGDGFASLYLLFHAVRQRSTVALSGEAADELFAGYPWFHAPQLRDADTFPWIAAQFDLMPALSGLLDPGLIADLDIDTYRADSYASALAEVPTLPGESPLERRIRELTYLNITRFVPILLDRKDRMSMATGLEVRVPFCDHRLVEYAFNVPWAMKSFDGREKSVLRAATQDLLPSSIAQRKKSSYPTTNDAGYDSALREEFVRRSSDSRIAPLLRSDIQLSDGWPTRGGLEFLLQLDTWLKTHSLVFP